MTIVIGSGDCGNSPKNIFLENLTTSFATGDRELLLNSVSEDIVWDIVGQEHIQGKPDFAAALEQRAKDRVAEIRIQHVATHGKAGAVNGSERLENGKTRAFCHMYEFTNTKGERIREITSYIIETS